MPGSSSHLKGSTAAENVLSNVSTPPKRAGKEAEDQSLTRSPEEMAQKIKGPEGLSLTLDPVRDPPQVTRWTPDGAPLSQL